MAYEAQVLEVMIASPSDVIEEREIVRSIVAEWNVIHSRDRGVVMLPLGWDTHSSPELGGRPQQLINDRILKHADILIGIFWTKLGTPTGNAVSGTAEEITNHHEAGRPVLLYFSDVPVVAGTLNQEQFAALSEFKQWALSQGLVHTYSTKDQFREDLRRHLQLCVQQNEYIQDVTEELSNEGLQIFSDQPPALSDDAKKVLKQASSGRNNHILLLRHLGGTSISAGGHGVTDVDSPRETARWEAAVEELLDQGSVRDVNGKREIFEVTHKGFTEADGLPESLASTD